MADLNQLKQKYQPVIDTIQSFSAEGASVQNVGLDGDKLLLKATVPSPVVANRVWDTIKQVDPTYSDLHHEIATSGRHRCTPSSRATIFRRSASTSTAMRTSTRRSHRPTTSPTPT